MTSVTHICDGAVVAFHYTLTDETGAVLDDSQGGPPLTYLHGAHNIVPGLESQMLGRSVGDHFSAVVPPAEGYGEYEAPGPQPIPRSEFPDSADLVVGTVFSVRAESGQEFNVWVTQIEDDRIYIDANHPLAGKTLTFTVDIVSLRPAHPNELEQGHPDRDGISG